MAADEDLKTEFGSRYPRVEMVAAKFLDLTPEIANRRAAKGDLPFPVFRIGSAKSPWLVDVKTLADFIEKQAIIAKQSYRQN